MPDEKEKGRFPKPGAPVPDEQPTDIEEPEPSDDVEDDDGG